MSNTKRIVVINQKGGAGKTTTSRMLIDHAVKRGKSVLAIDLDPQSHLSEWLGYGDQKWLDECESEASRIFSMEQPTDVLHTEFGCDLIPASNRLLLESMERVVSGKELLLRRFLNKIEANYDFVIVDTSPSIVSLTRSAIVACPHFVVPLETATMGAKGTVGFFTQIAETIDVYDCRVASIHILPTQYTKRQNDDNAILNDIYQDALPFIGLLPVYAGARVTATEPIPQNSSIKEAMGFLVSPQDSLADKRKSDVLATIDSICTDIMGV